MATRNNSLALKIVLGVGVLLLATSVPNFTAAAQAQAAPTPTANQLGTVQAISGNTITMATDKGQTVTVSVADGAKVYQLAAGSTDLKTAKPGQLADVAVGDRALVTGKAGETPATFSAVRLILMKSSDIAQMQAAQQADWKARGIGGIVNTVDPVSGTISITVGTRKVAVNTSSKTVFKRFAGDSVKYQDAKVGTIAQIQPKDQLQARGAKSADSASIDAEEVISGSFENLSGLLVSVDSAAGTISLKDLATKKMVTVSVTTNSDIRNMPAQMAARFAAESSSSGRSGGGGQVASGRAGGETHRSAGTDISQIIGRLPAITLADLHKGDAVMIVASQPTSGASAATAVTVLSGVDPILTANPNGGMDLSMSVGGGALPD
jgi:co-chaperonin GroES (HSP10)